MKTVLINLARSANRLAEFHGRNSHITGVERFEAVDGLTLAEPDLLRDKLVEEGHHFNKGAIGSALSHTALWKRCAVSGEPMTIIEDDAVLASRFEHHVERLVSEAGRWDLIAWGWNFDAPLWVDLMPPIDPFKLTADQDSLRANLESFRTADEVPSLMRLVHLFGTLCYSITPGGARHLLDRCLPIRAGVVNLEHAGLTGFAASIDVVMAAHYREMQAFVSVPPIAVSENRHESSTIVNSG